MLVAGALRSWRYRGLVARLAQRELKLRYKHSILGWLWSLISPAATLTIYTVVFGTFLRISPPIAGNGRLRSFAIWLFAGLLVWSFFSSVTTGSMAWLIGAGPLLRKIYFPPEAPLIAGSLTVLAQTGIEIAILSVVLVALGNASPVFGLVPLLIGLLLAMSLGVGLLISVLNVHYRDVSHLVGIGMSLLFYATPIIYPFEFVPAKIGGFPVREVVRLNPLTQFVGATRDVLYDLRAPSFARIAGLIVASSASLLLGWAVFRRLSPDLSEEL